MCVLVHISAAQKAGYTEPVDGARISYELVPSRNGKVSAEDSRLIWGPAGFFRLILCVG